MRRFVQVLAIGALVAFASFGCEARAGLILGGLQTQSAQSSKSYSGLAGIAQSFSYGSNFTLTGLDINLFNTTISNTGSYTVSLYSGQSLPGSKVDLGTGQWSGLWSTNSSNVVSLSGLNQSVAANTQYWIGVTTTTSGSARKWSVFDNRFGNGTSYTDTATYDGTTWGASTGSSTNAMGLKIYGTVVAPVPEIDPAMGGSALSLVAGVLAMIEQRRRRAAIAV
jgi:hypothetical protein